MNKDHADNQDEQQREVGYVPRIDDAPERGFRLRRGCVRRHHGARRAEKPGQDRFDHEQRQKQQQQSTRDAGARRVSRRRFRVVGLGRGAGSVFDLRQFCHNLQIAVGRGGAQLLGFDAAKIAFRRQRRRSARRHVHREQVLPAAGPNRHPVDATLVGVRKTNDGDLVLLLDRRRRGTAIGQGQRGIEAEKLRRQEFDQRLAGVDDAGRRAQSSESRQFVNERQVGRRARPTVPIDVRRGGDENDAAAMALPFDHGRIKGAAGASRRRLDAVGRQEGKQSPGRGARQDFDVFAETRGE